VLHVWEAMPSKRGRLKGQCNATDEEIAKFCATTEYVLVTTDSDFNGRWVRSGLLREHNVEVIVFVTELPGLAEQHRRITSHLPHWEQELSRQPYGFRVWEQDRRLKPTLRIGQARRKRARTFEGQKVRTGKP
jgi:predicted nuclease of predicted toxin-antitoxin system